MFMINLIKKSCFWKKIFFLQVVIKNENFIQIYLHRTYMHHKNKSNVILGEYKLQLIFEE